MTKDWNEIPKGFYLFRMLHTSGKHCHHLSLRLTDGPWFEQPAHVPAYSQAMAHNGKEESFWDWAQLNLPIFDYVPTP